MATKENTSSKKSNKIGQTKHSSAKKPFESSLRTYPSPSLGTKQHDITNNATPSVSDFNVTSMNWKADRTPTGPKGKGFASTPASRCITSLACDASVIEADRSCMPMIKEPLGPSLKNKRKNTFVRSKTDGAITPGKRNLPVLALGDDTWRKDKAEEDQASGEINSLYAEYIQALYLESKAKKGMAERDKFSLDNLQSLWKANQILMKQEKSLSYELDVIRSTNQLVEYCQKEEMTIEPIVDILSNVMNQYKEISDAVDTIRHKLYIPGATIAPEADIEAVISDILGHIKVCLIELFDNLSCHESKFAEVADLLAATERIMGEINIEIQRCLKLLSKADSMTITETSMKIGEIQSLNQ